MATDQEQAFLQRVTSTAQMLMTLEKSLRDLVEIYADRSYTSAITDQDILDAGYDFTAAQLDTWEYSATHLLNYFDNQTVESNDHRQNFNLVRGL